MNRKIAIVLILALLGGAFFYTQYNKKHVDTASQSADITLSPQELLAIYNADEKQADSLYLDKIIEVSGKVVSINPVEVGGSISLATGDEMSTIICEFEDVNAISSVQVGQMVTVKGICSGKLMDIVLSRCSVKM